MVKRAPSGWSLLGAPTVKSEPSNLSHGERNHVATKVEAGLRAGALLLEGMEGLASGENVIYERDYRR